MTPVIDSSATASDAASEGAGVQAGAGTVADGRPAWSYVGETGALALVIGVLVAVMYATHRSGHWWGDDWALYIRQAKGLLDGHPNRVLEENEFTVTMSRGSEFSPPLYPWGFPLLLVPFIAIVGDDLDRLTIVPVLCACVFACCWYALARPRIGVAPALVGVAAVTITPLLLSWTELIQSEWPFLAATGVALVGLDRAAASGLFDENDRRWLPLALVGLGAAAAFSVRREGLAMVAAIGFAQLAALGAGSVGLAVWRLPRASLGRLAARLAAPHLTFLLAVGLLQATLPSTVVPKYDGTSITNVWTLRGRLIRNLAQVSGLQRPWQRDPTVLGFTGLGWGLFAVILTLAVMGIVLAVWQYRTRDLHLAAYAIVAFLIGGSFRSPINRYVCTVAPIVLLFALVAAAVPLRHYAGRRTATVVLTLAMAAIVAGNVGNANLRIDGARLAEQADAIEWGPTHPDAIAMFDEVEMLTGPDDVVAAPKARAMVLETGRQAVQVDDYRPIPPDVDLALIVIEYNQDRRLAAAVAALPDQYEPVWQNARFVLYRPV